MFRLVLTRAVTATFACTIPEEQCEASSQDRIYCGGNTFICIGPCNGDRPFADGHCRIRVSAGTDGADSGAGVEQPGGN
jgi:hypothetical protein